MKEKEKITLKKVEVGQFEVRVAEKKVTIQSKNKMWKVEYTSETQPYSFMNYLIEHDSTDAIHTLILAMYNMALFFTNAEVTRGFLDLCAKELENAKPSEENEEEALEDVKNMERFKAEVKEED